MVSRSIDKIDEEWIMKKAYILFCVVFMILLVGCNSKSIDRFGTNELDKIKAELDLISKEYAPDRAVKDGCFVILHNEVNSKLENMDKIDKFVSDSQNGKLASITIAQYSINEYRSITKIVYDGIRYYGVEKDIRYDSNNTKYYQFEFKYLKIFEEKDTKRYLLFNDNEITYSKYIKSMISSNSNDFIKHHFICAYKN